MSTPPAIFLLAIGGTVFLFWAVFSAILVYHLHTYEMEQHRVPILLGAYFIGSLLLFFLLVSSGITAANV